MLDQDFIKDLFERMATKFGAPPNFIERLNAEDDWRFIINICIFTEEVCTDAILKQLGKPQLNDWVTKMPLVGGAAGKLKLLQQLSLVSGDNEKFIQGIADIRNRFAHRIKYSGMSLPEFFDQLPPNIKNEVMQRLAIGRALIDVHWGNTPRNSTYYRLIIETSFVVMVAEIANKGGLMKEMVDELNDSLRYLGSIVKRQA